MRHDVITRLRRAVGALAALCAIALPAAVVVMILWAGVEAR